MFSIFNKIKRYWNQAYIDLTNFRINDSEIIKELINDGVTTGAYDKSFIEDKHMFNDFTLKISQNEALLDVYKRKVFGMSCSYTPSRMKYVLFNQDMFTIGYIVLALNFDDKSIEIWHFSLLPKYRNKGLGKAYLKVLINFLDREFNGMKIFARCHKDNSQVMQSILKENGFKQIDQNSEGYNFLIKI